jgi:hypothetical protein
MILDPSGPLSKLCDLPELRPYARPINLLNAQPGILDPYRVVAEPRFEHFAEEEDPERALRRGRRSPRTGNWTSASPGS